MRALPLRRPRPPAILAPMTTDPLVGAALGPCRLEALIGAGGMGRVYRARHLKLDRTVAVKLVEDRSGASGAAATAAVLAEARAAAKLDDPRVVAVYDVGEDQGRAFIVMQWVEGETLEARVRRAGPLAFEEALRVMKETAAALGAAHAAGLVHRDVKPANILIDSKGAVKLTDFGLAGSAGGAAEGVTVGSFHFMAPEQGYGVAPHPSADWYAFGATWFYALAGRPPFKGTGAEAMVRHREEAPPDIRELRPDATVRAAALIARLMSKDPAARPSGAAEVLKELSNPSMTLDTDETGSPFRILPPPKPEIRPGDPPPSPAGFAAPAAAVPAVPAPARPAAPAPAFVPPPAPPAAPEAVLGSRAAFFGLGGVIALAAVGWPWRSAVAADWVAGAAFLSAFPALLTLGDRKAAWRKAAGPALWAGGAACLLRYAADAGGVPLPPLETMIVAALGAGCSLGAVYMGLWGTDTEEVFWARALGPLGGVLLAVAALAWKVPAEGGWTAALGAAASSAWASWWSSGGVWRWGGLAAVTAAGAAARRLKTVSAVPQDRKLNWNK